MHELVSEALTEKLSVTRIEERSWMKSFGKLRACRKETARINRIIEDEFENIEPAYRKSVF